MYKRFNLNLDPSFQARPRLTRPMAQTVPTSRPFPMLLAAVAVLTMAFSAGLLL